MRGSVLVLALVAIASCVVAMGGGGGGVRMSAPAPMRSSSSYSAPRISAPQISAPRISSPSYSSISSNNMFAKTSIGGPSFRPPSFSTSYRAPVTNTFMRAPAQPAYRAPAQPAYRAPAQPAYRAPAQPAFRAPAAVPGRGNFGLSGPRAPAGSNGMNIGSRPGSSFGLNGPRAPTGFRGVGAAPSLRYGTFQGPQPKPAIPNTRFGHNAFGGFKNMQNPNGMTIGGGRFDTKRNSGTMFGNRAFGPQYFKNTAVYKPGVGSQGNFRYGYRSAPQVKAQTQNFAPNGLKIDHSFIKKEEGMKLDMYVPTRGGKVIQKSGPTIANGFDVGQQKHLNDLRKNGLDPALADKLTPYLNMNKQAALEFVQKNPLRITEAEGANLKAAVERTYDNYAAKGYNAKGLGGPKFADLPAQAQTVIASINHQYGNLNGASFQPVLKNIAAGDYNTAAAELRKVDLGFADRRGREANFLATAN